MLGFVLLLLRRRLNDLRQDTFPTNPRDQTLDSERGREWSAEQDWDVVSKGHMSSRLLGTRNSKSIPNLIYSVSFTKSCSRDGHKPVLVRSNLH